MKRIIKVILFVALIGFIATGCSGSKKSQCACPNKKGFVGY